MYSPGHQPNTVDSNESHAVPVSVTIRQDSAVSPNLAAADKSDVSAFPGVCRVGETVVCVYRRGTSKYSRDGVLLAQSSSDGGNSWSDPVSVFDRTAVSEPESVHYGVVCEHDGAAAAFFKTVEAKNSDAYIFSEEGRRLRQRTYMCRSENGGNSWSTSVEVELKGGPRDTFLGSRPLSLPGGRLLMPVEATGEHGQQFMMGSFSDDGGRSFSPLFPIMHDESGKLGFGDGKVAILPDGRIVMLAWTYINSSEETIQVHQCVSSDGGCTWSPPQPTDTVCQIMTPLVLADGSLLAAGNVRTQVEGIRLFHSVDCGKTWSDFPIQLWDPAKKKVTAVPLPVEPRPGKGEELWNSLPSYDFGTPEMTMLDDGEILLVYYATVDEVIHVRACRFAI